MHKVMLVTGGSRGIGAATAIASAREGYAVPQSQLTRDVSARVEPVAEVQAILVTVYRSDPKNAELCERLVDLDVGVQE